MTAAAVREHITALRATTAAATRAIGGSTE